MSGHSKWHSIKHKKAASDAKKGKLFTQLARAITVAARKGGGDENFNFALRIAVDKAKAGNMPKDNIERAIKRGTGELEGAEISENRYEGYGPGGIAVIVDALTDNSNRTVAELRHIFSKHGGNLEGSVAWQFEAKGVIAVNGQADKADNEEWMLEAIDAGVEEVESDDGNLMVVTLPDHLQKVKEWLEEKNMEIESADLIMIAKDRIPIEKNVEEQLNKMLNALEEHDDVDKIYHNADI